MQERKVQDEITSEYKNEILTSAPIPSHKRLHSEQRGSEWFGKESFWVGKHGGNPVGPSVPRACQRQRR